jgi:hypothetical protein
MNGAQTDQPLEAEEMRSRHPGPAQNPSRSNTDIENVSGYAEYFSTSTGAKRDPHRPVSPISLMEMYSEEGKRDG